MKTGIFEAIELLPNNISNIVRSCLKLNDIDEIRLRLNKPISISAYGKNIFLHNDGAIGELDSDVLYASDSDIEHTFKSAFSYSLHSYSKELASGYVTSKGGNRIGVCGTAVLNSNDVNSVDTLKYISSVNIRISREITGCAQKVVDICGLSSSVLIIGPPSSGKTTLLRDLSRLIGSAYKVSLIDELNEISATYKNEAFCDIGLLTDVFVGYPKHIGITTAIKVMSPSVLIVDEIGTNEDIKALNYAINSGVRLVTAIHSDSLENTKQKPEIAKLISIGAFDYAVVLKPYSSFNHDYKVIKLD